MGFVALASPSPSRIDGRVQRGERTRNAIADALLVLLERGDPQPTAREIAREAGVSLRSVFQHFADMEAVYAMCVVRQHERLEPLRLSLDAAAPLTTRVDRLIAQRTRLYERIAPVRRACLVVAPESQALRQGLEDAARAHRREIGALFGAELSGAGRRDRLAAVEVATSFDTWDHLRRVQGCSLPAAQRAVRRLLEGVLA